MRPGQLLLITLLLPAAASAGERILDTRDGSTLNRDQLIERIADNAFILLGELHDNPRHHKHRGELLTAMQQRTPLIVVAEHLERGKRYAADSDLKSDLERAGFDARGWHWPLHEAMFAQISTAAIPLFGGNIPRETARNTVRQGESALPAELAKIIAEAPLDESAQANLDTDLQDSHCSQLPAGMLEGLRLAQRGRDAAMFEVMRQNNNAGATALLAGNGHVRLDYGIPSLIRKHLPDARHVAIGFIEETNDKEIDARSYRERFDYVWVVAKVESRDDPCASFGQAGKDR
jgi:uncharacterized iron-regulated protein